MKLKHLLVFLLATISTSCAHQLPPVMVAPPAGAGTATAAPAVGIEAAGKLHGYLHKLKCGDAQDARSCKLSADQERSRLDVVLAGNPGQIYQVKLRVRGLLEPRRYTGGALVDPSNKWLYAGGAPDPLRKNNGQALPARIESTSDVAAAGDRVCTNRAPPSWPRGRAAPAGAFVPRGHRLISPA